MTIYYRKSLKEELMENKHQKIFGDIGKNFNNIEYFNEGVNDQLRHIESEIRVEINKYANAPKN